MTPTLAGEAKQTMRAIVQEGYGSADALTLRVIERPALAEGDILIVRGDAETAGAFAADKLVAFREEGAASDTLFNRMSGLAEVVIPPRSAFLVTPSNCLGTP